MEKIIIKKKDVMKRIDKFLAEEFFLYSRGEVIKKIKNGDALVNGKEIKQNYILKEGDIIQLENFSKEKNNKLVANDKIPLQILFEDDNIIIINKQAGIQVHPSYNEKNNTIVNAIISHFPGIINVHDDSIEGNLRPGIVHRLDKDTSGVMVIAKNKKTFDELKKKFKGRSIEKTYIAVCKGIFVEKRGSVKKSVAKSSNYRKQIIARENTKTTIRKAVTDYEVIKEYGNKISLVKVSPKTGRMHQIRLHLASIGHPIIGDLLYGQPKDKALSAKRHLLHAKKLKFELFGKKYGFTAPTPPDFEDFLARVD